MKDNLDLFITTFKDFMPSVTSKCYKVIHGNNTVKSCGYLPIVDCTGSTELDDKFYSEIYMFKWLVKNYKLREYVGFCQYRRYWEFLDRVPDMDELFSKNDIVTVKKLKFKSNTLAQYQASHNAEDLLIVRDIVSVKYPDYTKAFSDFLSHNEMYPYNMFIMRREDFIKYVGFLTGVLDEYVSIVGRDINKRILSNASKYIKPYVPCNTLEYQYRIGGYLGERLTSIYIMKNFSRVREYDIIKTLKKYRGEPD